MRPLLLAILIGLAFSTVAATTTLAQPKKPSPSRVPAVKKTLAQAKVIALAAVPGTIAQAELEKEHGVWIYSIEVHPTGDKNPKHLKEVVIDANSGRVIKIEDEHEDDHDSDTDRDSDTER